MTIDKVSVSLAVLCVQCCDSKTWLMLTLFRDFFKGGKSCQAKIDGFGANLVPAVCDSR